MKGGMVSESVIGQCGAGQAEVAEEDQQVLDGHKAIPVEVGCAGCRGVAVKGQDAVGVIVAGKGGAIGVGPAGKRGVAVGAEPREDLTGFGEVEFEREGFRSVHALVHRWGGGVVAINRQSAIGDGALRKQGGRSSAMALRVEGCDGGVCRGPKAIDQDLSHHDT